MSYDLLTTKAVIRKEYMMGQTLTKTTVRLIKDAWLLPSHEVPTSVEDFEEMATFFPVGTIFTNEPDTDDPDCDIHTPSGWCYSLPDKPHDHTFTGPCNFQKYILDKWQNYPELFGEF